MTTPPGWLARELSRDGARPLITAYDDATGERIELSVATTANWVAKTANYLADELGVEPGDPVSVLLRLHWQAAVVLLAAWSVGAEVSFEPGGDVAFLGPDRPDADGSTGREIVRLSFAPMGADFSRLVAAQPDRFAMATPSGPDRAIALPAGVRILTALPYDNEVGLSVGLLGPLAAGGSIVLALHPNADLLPGRCQTERVTHTAGVDVAGLPRLDR